MEADKESHCKVIQEAPEERMSSRLEGRATRKTEAEFTHDDVSASCFPEPQGAHLPSLPAGLSLLDLVQHNSRGQGSRQGISV